ncbi:ABC transporter permease [Virgibacillus profundi]|uniref:ABC transporter permease n=1 Tax=Virgibacillus profundi TaxID=2024555 RepID=A0A2A2IDS5_9BACI|nr:ABC transporter permease subunit [Virgibacillus profundi]PAV29414.1 ABC transporter permease [Virgibacillus profundi]PXY53584.1 ABC transporter permease [Virgibacillus profundi]
MKSLLINPVLNKEIKLRFRSFKSFLGVFFYLFALGGIAIGFILMNTVFSYNASAIFRPEQSRTMFMVLSFVQMALILFMTPGLTSGVISGERERQTLNILLTTPQSSTSIILSKLISSIAYLLLMMVASLPLYSIVFLFGGVSPALLGATFGLYFITMLAIGSIGILFSTLIRKTIIATIITYGITLFFTAGTAILTMIGMQFVNFQNLNQTSVMPYITSMFNPFIILLASFEEGVTNEINSMSGIEFSLITGFVLSFLLISFICLFISIKKLRPKMKAKKELPEGE